MFIERKELLNELVGVGINGGHEVCEVHFRKLLDFEGYTHNNVTILSLFFDQLSNVIAIILHQHYHRNLDLFRVVRYQQDLIEVFSVHIPNNHH